MASLSSCVFPLEIISLILDELTDRYDYRVLCSCRLVCKTFESLATPHVFRVLILSENEDSRAAFSNIAEHSRLALLVKTIEFTYVDLEPDDDVYGGSYLDNGTAFSQIFHIWPNAPAFLTEEIGNISDIFLNLPRLPNLEKLLCDFPGEFANCDAIGCGASRSLSLQSKMFERFGECYNTSASQEENGCSIATANSRGIGEDSDSTLQIQNKSQLRSIKLEGIVPVAHGHGRGLRSTGLGLPVFFQSIQTMDLSLQVEEFNEAFYGSHSYLDFWRTDMRNLMFMMTSSLTSLSLSNNVKTVGFDCPTWDSLTFPSLLYLHLSSIVFNDHEFFNQQETGVEAFILRHAPTLQHLVLSECLLNLGADPRDVPVTPGTRTWDDIFQSFNEKLAVKSFTFTPIPELAKAEGYVSWCYYGCYL